MLSLSGLLVLRGAASVFLARALRSAVFNVQWLEWCLTRSQLEEGISLAQVSPQLDWCSDASDLGWGFSSGRGSRFRPLVARGSGAVH